jgi:hypothetical protein
VFFGHYLPRSIKQPKISAMDRDHSYGILAPSTSMAGDLVVVLDGSPLPFVLRQVDEVAFRLIGPGWFFKKYDPGLHFPTPARHIFDFNIWVDVLQETRKESSHAAVDRFKEIRKDRAMPEDDNNATYFTLI